MATEVLIPKLGMTMEEGTVAEWHVPDGGEVKTGESIYRLETEKIEFEVEAESDGTLCHLVEEGATLSCGAVVAYVLAPGEALPAGVQPLAADATSATAPVMASVAAAPPIASSGDGERVAATPAARRLAESRGIDLRALSGSGPGGRITEADVPERAPSRAEPDSAAGAAPAASPLARRVAEQLGVDLARVRGTGPGGRVTREDVEATAASARPAAKAAEAPPSPPARAASGEAIPVRGMRRVIAERMHQSLRDMAQLTLTMDAWMDEAVSLRRQLVDEWAADGVRPSFTDLVLRAVAKAVPQHPLANAEFRGTEIVAHPDIHVGMAVAVDSGLVVPVIRHADRLTLKDLAKESSRLADGARSGKLGPDEYAGATISVTPLGMFGVDAFTPIINPPNSVILGVGRIHDGVGWDGDRPLKRQVMTLSLTWDHRVLDGVPAAQFVQAVKALLEAPYRLLV